MEPPHRAPDGGQRRLSRHPRVVAARRSATVDDVHHRGDRNALRALRSAPAQAAWAAGTAPRLRWRGRCDRLFAERMPVLPAAAPSHSPPPSNAPDFQTRAAAARSPLCGPAMLDRLSHDPESGVRVAVARHRRCSVDLLTRLARDTSWAVRQTVAVDPRLPADAVLRLSHAPEPEVRAAAASNAALGFDRLEMPAGCWRRGCGSARRRSPRSVPPSL